MDDKPQLWSLKAGEEGMTELHYAAYCQDLAGVRYWVEQGLDVNQKDEGGWTPLFAGLSKPLDLNLISRQEFASGAVAMRYEPKW